MSELPLMPQTSEPALAAFLRRANTRPPPVARSGRTLLVVGLVGQLFALVQLIGAWHLYRQPLVVLGFWTAMTASLPILTFAVARFGGGSASRRGTLPLLALLAVADVLVPAQATSARIGQAGWNWSAVAILLLALAVYRPVLDVMVLCALHSAAVLAWAFLPAANSATVEPQIVVLVLAGAIIPPLVAAQFVNFYVGMLSEREEAGRQAAAIEAREAAEAAVERDGRRRLSRIRAEAVPLLQHVVQGAAIPLDAERAESARLAAARLRSQLLEGRDVAWLLAATDGPDGLDSPDGLDGSDGPDDDPVVEVRVVTDNVARRLLDGDLRSAIASLVGLLRRHRPWDQVAVTLTGRQESELVITVVATGDCAVRAAQDRAIETAARRLGAELSVVEERIVVIEGVVAGLPRLSVGADIV